MQRRTKRVARALSLKARRKPSIPTVIPLPKPQFEFEDTLVTQLRAADVLSNCYEEYDGDITLGVNHDPPSPRKGVALRHPCHYDNCLVPVWQAYYNLDKRATGAVLLGRLMNLSSIVGPILNNRYITEKSVHEHFIDTTHVTFNQYKNYIEKCVERNALAFTIDWLQLRSVCWSQCEVWHLQALPFDLPDGNVPSELHHALYWLWCVFCQITEPDTYPPSADYEEIELLLRKLFSSIGLLWEENEDGVSSVSASSISSSNNTHEQNGTHSMKSFDGSNSRIIEDEHMNGEDDPSVPTMETLLVTFQQFLSIISDMLGSETIFSPAFTRAVKQIYLTEVDEIIIAGWMSFKKPGGEVWKRRWTILRRNALEFYSGTACEEVKYKIVLNNKMHVESLPDTSSHKHRFRLVEREGDFNIAWETEMSCSDAQHSHSWMLVMNLTMKIQQTGLTSKRMEVAERRLERHRRRESEISAIEKRREVRKTQEKMQEVRERWNLMQTKLNERASRRDAAMATVQKMDEVYDKLQAITKKQSLIRKTEKRIRSAFPVLSEENELTREEKLLMKSRDEKLDELQRKIKKLQDDRGRLEEQLLELQATAVLAKDSERTLIFVYGPERQATFEEQQEKRRASSTVSSRQTMIERGKRRSPVPRSGIPTISISTSALSSSPSSLSSSGSARMTTHSQSHPELRDDHVIVGNGYEQINGPKTIITFDPDFSGVTAERLV